MATTLQLKQGDSGTTLTLNSSGSTGFRLEENGWNPAIASPVYMGDPPPVLERFDLLLSNTSYDNLASSMQSLHEMQVIADRYMNDRTQENPVWLHAQMDGETSGRRALVRNIDIQYAPSWFGAGQTTTNIPLVVTIERGPYWENPSVNTSGSLGSTAGACVTFDYTAAGSGDPNGDVPGRVRYCEIDDDNISRFWLGLRSANKHGATGISNFETIWECEDGTNDPDSVESGITDQVDATASGGDVVRLVETDVDWDDGSWRRVLNHTLTQASTNEEDQFGNFLWLLRAKIDGSTTWEVYLNFHSSISGTTVNIKNNIVEINDSDWRFYEMGINPIAIRNIQIITESDQPKTQDGDYSISINARRTSGSGNIYFDCLIPLPIDEGFIKLDYKIGGIGFVRGFGQGVKGEWGGIVEGGGQTRDVPPVPDSVENFAIPPGDGRIYAVFERDGLSNISDTINFNFIKYYERWLSLRGSE